MQVLVTYFADFSPGFTDRETGQSEEIPYFQSFSGLWQKSKMSKLFSGQQGNRKYYSNQQTDCSCTNQPAQEVWFVEIFIKSTRNPIPAISEFNSKHGLEKTYIKKVLTLPLIASISISAFLAHFCQKLGSSSEISVLFPDATKLACNK